MPKFRPADKVYFIQSNQTVKEATVVSFSGGFYSLRYTGYTGEGMIRLKEHRLFGSKEEAEARKKEHKK